MNEEVIWNSITNSAKSRFDYQEFAQPYIDAGLPESFLDNMVFQTICHLVEKEPIPVIKAKLRTNLMLAGFDIDDTVLEEYLQDKDKLFQKEIFLTGTAFQMLENGSELMQVQLFVMNFLRD